MKNILKVLKIICIILKKDLLQEIKSKEIIISMLSYSVLVLVVVATTLKINSNNSLIIFGTIYWISVSFSILLGINKSMSKEMGILCEVIIYFFMICVLSYTKS